MIVRLLFAALLGGAIGGAELVARYRDKPSTAVLSPSGLLYVFVNASASILALVAVQAAGWRFGLPAGVPAVSEYVVQVMAAGLGAAVLFRASFTLAQDKGISFGPISILHGMLKIVDAALERKRALSRLSHNDLAGLSFVRDHAALAELSCHALQRFDLAEAQRLGELAADLLAREDLTDADKLDCFGLELSRLVGERALRKAADRLRERSVAHQGAGAEVAAYGEGVPAYAGYAEEAQVHGEHEVRYLEPQEHAHPAEREQAQEQPHETHRPRPRQRPEPVEVPRMSQIAPAAAEPADEGHAWRDERRQPVAVAVGQEAHGTSEPPSLRSYDGRDEPSPGADSAASERTLRFKAPPGSGRLTRRSIRDS